MQGDPALKSSEIDRAANGDRVLVAGATGGVGQLTVGTLLTQGFQVRALCRSVEKAQQMFDERVEVAIADTRNPATLLPAMEDISHIICCTGTTAFPSTRWQFEAIQERQGLQRLMAWGKLLLNPADCKTQARNGPEQVDVRGVQNLVAAAPKTLQQFIFVSSCGIQRRDRFPFSVLNTFGVLDAKQKGETTIMQSGLPFTIIRPGRLIDGPFTSYDLNTLLKATTGGKSGITIGTGDTLSGQASRIDVAAVCVACLSNPVTIGKIFELINQGPRPTAIDWEDLLTDSLDRGKS